MSEKWTDAETFKLINSMKRADNFKVLYGPKAGENTSGESKATVYTYDLSTHSTLYASSTSATRAINRMKNKISWLEKSFKTQAKRLKKTGEGIEEMWYIAPAGPDHDTPERAQNIWEAILEDFVFFKANFVPVCYTTGLGPNGAQTVLLQSSGPPPLSPHQNPTRLFLCYKLQSR
ncbi:hypothetical protein K435DRAFT_845119 [Dendrothele bispora CBS 962.96]|uniref:Uncharacterized protein n=1 Tax=Dendrothele bispora (strain CBS 962.96) TaxID=1314807 RepID=A0A4S8KWR0_DENBC|nr:hypothetical protein K435DRAFT_845119 [Dendrothele bispora CBS 962.96]